MSVKNPELYPGKFREKIFFFNSPFCLFLFSNSPIIQWCVNQHPLIFNTLKSVLFVWKMNLFNNLINYLTFFNNSSIEFVIIIIHYVHLECSFGMFRNLRPIHSLRKMSPTAYFLKDIYMILYYKDIAAKLFLIFFWKKPDSQICQRVSKMSKSSKFFTLASSKIWKK